MTIPLGLAAERYGPGAVLLLNLAPRIAMPAWAVAVGYSDHALPANAIMAAPLLSVLGGDCVFNSLTYAVASGLTDDHVVRYAIPAFSECLSATSLLTASAVTERRTLAT